MQRIDIKQIKPNTGQIEGVPANPRQWKKGDVEKLARSIEQTPELFDLRPIIVYDNVDGYVAIGGNMRLAAAKFLKWKDVPCEIVSRETSTAKLKEIVIKDNGAFGEWDMDALANEWDDLPLGDWGVDIPDTTATELSSQTNSVENDMYYEPRFSVETLSEAMNFELYDKKKKALKEQGVEITKEIEALLSRFIRVDYEKIADFYFTKASEKEKTAIERCRAILLDSQLEGFRMDELLL